MLAPALLITVALVPAKMPMSLVPVMLPELVTLAAPDWTEIPLSPPVMLAPKLLVTVAEVSAKIPRLPPVILPELPTLAVPDWH